MKKIAVMFVALMTLCLTLGTAMADEGVLTLPAGLVTVDSEAFKGVTSANRVVVQSGATTIGAGAFENGGFSEIQLPNTITEIGAGAFRNCGKATDSLKYYCIPAGISVGEGAFEGCRATVTINGSIVPYFQYQVKENGVTITGLYGGYGIQEAVIPETIEGKPVTAIGNRVFSGKGTLTRVTIPATVTSIGENAFYNCGALTSVQLPAGLTNIGTKAFQNCGLTGTLTVPAGITAIQAYTFAGNKSLLQVNLPAGITTIGTEAFYDCYAMQQINLPAAVTEMGTKVFGYNKELSEITIPEGITELPNELFRGCEKLSSVHLPAGLTGIGENAFRDCTRLTTVNIPTGLTTIGKDAFQNACVNQAGNNIYELPESLTSIGTNAFYNCGAGLCVIRNGTVENMLRDSGLEFTRHGEHDFRYKYVSADSEWTLKVTGYKGEGGDVVIPAGAAVIAERAFYGKTAITGVTIPDGITTVERWAFENCSNMTTLVMPDSVIKVLDSGFKSCAKLTDITFSQSLTELGGDAFNGCCVGQSGVHYYNLPEGLGSFNSYTFDNCGAVLVVGHQSATETKMLSDQLYVFTYPDRKDFRYRRDGQKRSLWSYAGSGTSLITLPDDCELVRRDGFKDLVDGGLICTQLSMTDAALSAAELNHTYPGHEDFRYRVMDGILYIMSYAGSATQITIPEATAYIQAEWDEQIYKQAFMNLTEVTKVVIPEGVTRINDQAFEGCENLTDINLPASLRSMGTKVFRYCGKNYGQTFYVYLPDNIEDIYGDGGGANSFENFYDYHNMAGEGDSQSYATLVCGLNTTTARTLSDGNFNFAIRGHHDDGLIYRYENRVIEGENDNQPMYRLFLYDYVGEARQVVIPDDIGLYGVSRTPPGGSDPWRGAFLGSNITGVVIPEGVVVISQHAFKDCHSLTDITLPASLKRMRERCFMNVGHTGTRFIVVIPAGVQTFYAGSFMSFQDSGATLVALGSFVQEELYNNMWQFYESVANAEANDIRYIRRKPQEGVENPKWYGAP